MIPAVDVVLASTRANGEDVPVGRCRFNLRHGSLGTAFTYDDSYLSRADAFAIDPALPLDAAPHYTDGIPGVMRDSAPDRWGRHLIARRARADVPRGPFRTLDEVDYLIGVHDLAREGALRFRDPQTGEFLSAQGDIPPIVELKRLLVASNEVARGEEGIGEVKELLDAGSGSLGGARPKASVVDEGKLFMAKFPHPGDDWDVMAWEKTALDLAAQAGVAVPMSRLVRLGRESVLLLERFDRAESMLVGGRVPYMSGMTALGASDGEQRDYVELAEQMATFVNEPERELAALFRRVVLSIALHNTDDHLRNIAFLRENGGWHLAPAYDVNPNPDGTHPRVTSVFGETDRGETEGLRALAEVCGVAGSAMTPIIRDVLDAMHSWHTIARRNGCRDSELALFEPVVQNRCAALEAVLSS